MKPQIDPELAVNALRDVLRAGNRKEIPIADYLQEHIKMIASFPEAKGKIAFDEERGMLLLLDRDD